MRKLCFEFTDLMILQRFINSRNDATSLAILAVNSNTVFTGIRARALIKIQSFFRKTGRATSHRPTGLRWCAVALAFGVMGPNSSRGPNSSKYGI